MNPLVEKIPHSDSERSVRLPTIKNNINFFARIYFQQILKTFDNDKRVFPVKEPPVYFASMGIDGCWHFQQSSCLLLRGIFHAFFLRVYMPTIFFDGNFCLFIKTKKNAIRGKMLLQLFYSKFFFAKSGSLLYSQGVFFLYFTSSCPIILPTCEGLTLIPWLIA